MHRPSVIAAISISCLYLATFTADEAHADRPTVHDSRLELTLFAEHPDIVTPVGMVIDDDRIYVIESHTHLRPNDYEGPAADRIKVFFDEDFDGRPDRIGVFADGLTAAMNLALSPGGVLYAVCAREVVSLRDTDGDCRCDEKVRVLELDTSERYPHNSLLGITFSVDGWMYVARGNVSSKKYVLKGSDGSRVSGYGDGGNIVRCRPDGSNLEEFATGFWNPFDIKFDHAGRLRCVDNDPDARGPNRFLHVVRHGDYGYKSLYGGGGNHPFQGWTGDLPGTLPIISGTGEAPSGLMDCRRAALPEEYANSTWITVWNENSVESHQVTPRGVSLVAESSVVISGGQDFRPVAIDADSKGNVYITDWVHVDYPNHGQGRIWRLSAKPGIKWTKPRPYFGVYSPSDGERRLVKLTESNEAPSRRLVVDALTSRDPFLHHAATVALSRRVFHSEIQALANHHDADVRLGSLLAARRMAGADGETMARRFLEDPDDRVRRAALVWIGEAGMTELRDEIGAAIGGSNVSAVLIETYLAACQHLESDFLRDYRAKKEPRSRDLWRPIRGKFIAELAQDASRAPAVRALAMARLQAVDDERTQRLLLDLAASPHESLQLAAIRRLAGSSSGEVSDALLGIAKDVTRSSTVRAESLLALSRAGGLDPASILTLLNDDRPDVRIETVKTLRSYRGIRTVQDALEEKLAAVRGLESETELREELHFCLAADMQPVRPDTIEEWKSSLSEGGDVAAGRRVFYSAHTMCSNCHTIGGLGGMLGPDLSNVAQSLDRQQIIHSILRPSDQFPPQYQAWTVFTNDGRTFTGLQLDHKSGGDIQLFTTDGETVHFDADEIEGYEASRRSVMPSELETTMTVSEFRNLVAFLETLR